MNVKSKFASLLTASTISFIICIISEPSGFCRYALRECLFSTASKYSALVI